MPFKDLQSSAPSIGPNDIDLSKLDINLLAVLTKASSRADFNRASYDVQISTHKPIYPGEYLGQDNKPLPGVEIRGAGASTKMSDSVTLAALKPLSRDPNVKFIQNSSPRSGI